MQRLSGLDYLRGICALGIMFFHFDLWNFGADPSDSIFTRIGIYGVSIFYVLSGLTLYHVYHNKLRSNWDSVWDFYLKRIFRIFPLLWLSIIFTLIIQRQLPDPGVLIANLTGFFAFHDWEKTITYGSWSVGNELTFYLLFPPLILFLRRWNSLFFALLIISFALLAYFAFGVIDPRIEFYVQWHSYTNPLNQFFLFIAGVGLGALLKNSEMSSMQGKMILLFSLLIFIWYPTTGERVELATGINRLVFIIASIGICVGTYKSDFKLPSMVNKSLLMLGHASYSIYLLHPLVYRVVSKAFSVVHEQFFEEHIWVVMVTAGASTVVFSYFIYQNFERFFTSLGRKSPEKVSVN